MSTSKKPSKTVEDLPAPYTPPPAPLGPRETIREAADAKARAAADELGAALALLEKLDKSRRAFHGGAVPGWFDELNVKAAQACRDALADLAKSLGISTTDSDPGATGSP